MEHSVYVDSRFRGHGVGRLLLQQIIELARGKDYDVLIGGIDTANKPSIAPATAHAPCGPVSRREEQPLWKDPASGYIRRNISQPRFPQPMQIVEVHFPPGQRVAFESSGRDVRVHQQIWVLEGAIEITLGEECYKLREGDCLAMQIDRPIMFHNRTRKTARYAVVMA